MTYHDSNDPTNRSVDRPGSKWAWILGLALAIVLGFAIYSAFSPDGDEGTYPEAVPAAGKQDPVEQRSPEPDDPRWPAPIQPPPVPDRGG